MGRTVELDRLNGPQAAINIVTVYASFGWAVVFMERDKKHSVKHRLPMLLQAADRTSTAAKNRFKLHLSHSTPLN
jgi:hypothetical protein